MEKNNLILRSLTTAALLLGGCGSSSDTAATGSGKAGSMARFAINGNHLYTINGSDIQIFDVTNPLNTVAQSYFHVDWAIETLFSYQDYLYIGANDGMHIYQKNVYGDLTLQSFMTHATSCDPVVVANDVAYVTLNSGGSCNINSTTDVLEMYDVADPTNIRFINRLNMWEPKGLGVSDNRLFVCDGTAGLKVYDINQTSYLNEVNATENNVTLTLLDNNDSVNCYDLIASQNLLQTSNGTDLSQFDYSAIPLTHVSDITQ